MRNALLEMFPMGNPYPEDGDRNRYDPITAIAGGSAILGGVTSLFGARKSAKAAKDAALVQQAAADKASQWVTDAAAAGNRDIVSGADRAGEAATTAATDAGTGVRTSADRANALLDPYRASGDAATAELDRGLVAGGDFNRTPTKADIEIDPGFGFRLLESQRAYDRSAAARGGAVSGTALMDLERVRQGMASEEYAKAFERFRASTGDRFGRLNTVAGRGFQAAGVEGDNLIDAEKFAGGLSYDAAKYGGDKTYDAAVTTARNTNVATTQAGEFTLQGANANASGKVGEANAWNEGLGGVADAVNSGAGIYLAGKNKLPNLLKNPAARKAA
ncbi:MAG: hypothetical protein IT514_16230 [Burkholderiales bacterium]|nr:hypothetical protein [Burkholderiales bacterium]